jgi:hypothetical protein
LLLAACKSGNTGVHAGNTTSAPTSGPPATGLPTTAPPTTDAALAAKARAAVMQAGDFPAGWSTQPPGEGLNIDQVWQDLTQCLGVKSAAPVAAATSPSFLQGLATQARSTVEYASPSAAADVAAALTSSTTTTGGGAGASGSTFDRCATAAFTADLNRSKPEGSTPGTVTVAPRDYPQEGQKTFAWRINATVNLQDLQVPLFQDFLVVFNGNAVMRFFFLNPGSDFPQNLERSLVEKVVARA